MIQQINLYQEVLRETKTSVQKIWYGIGFSLLLFLVIAYSVWQSWKVQQLQNELKTKQAQLTTEVTDLSRIQLQYPKKEIDPLLINEIDRLQNISRSLERVVSLLSDKLSDQNRGFSHYFSALAEQSIATIWLTEIEIDTETNNIRLHGSTYLPEYLPVLIKRLNKEDSFKGLHFAHLHMHASENNENKINFTISSLMPEEMPAS